MVLPQAHTMKNTYKTKAHITTSRAADVDFFLISKLFTRNIQLYYIFITNETLPKRMFAFITMYNVNFYCQHYSA